jgi:PKD repeat protein
VRVTDAYGFTAQDTIEVLGNVLNLNLGPNLFRCPGDTATFSSNVSNVSYLWSTGDTTPSITVTQPGIYTLQITDQYGCIKRDTVELINHVAPNFILGNDTSFCAGGYIELNANANLAGSSYLWNNGSTSTRLVVTAPGTYSVTVTSPNGCSASDTITIGLLYQPNVNLGPDVTLCQSTPLVLNAYNPNCTYLWNTGDTTSSITVTQPGTYSVLVTGSGGCTSSDTMVFSYFNPADVEIGQPVTSCGSTLLSVQNPQQGVTYLWSTGATGPSALVTQSGQVIVQATTSDGCIAYDTTIVTIFPEVTARIGGLDTVYLNVPAQLVDASFPNPSSWQWIISDGGFYTIQNPTHTFTSEGTFVITLIVGNGVCSDTSYKTVHVVKEPKVSKEQWNGLQEVLVYPNPNHGHFVVSAEFSNLNEVKIELMNSVGQKVYENKLGMVSSFKQTVDVKDLAAGIYYLKISSPDGFVTLKLAIH